MIGENLYEVLEGERARLQNELSGVLKALSREHQQFVAGRVSDHQAHLKHSAQAQSVSEGAESERQSLRPNTRIMPEACYQSNTLIPRV